MLVYYRASHDGTNPEQVVLGAMNTQGSLRTRALLQGCKNTVNVFYVFITQFLQLLVLKGEKHVRTAGPSNERKADSLHRTAA